MARCCAARDRILGPLLASALCSHLAACQPKPAQPQAAPLDVQLSVDARPTRVSAGRPVAVAYRWATGAAFQGLPDTTCVFAHFLATDGAMLVNDDHDLPSPSSWRANRTYEYRRLAFPPEQFPGPLRIRVGLFDRRRGDRLLIHGADVRGRFVEAPSIQVTPADRSTRVRYGPGFYAPDSGAGQPFVIPRWMQASGSVSFPNPRQDTMLFLHASTNHAAFQTPPILELALGGRRLSSRPIHASDRFTLAVPLPAALLADQDEVDLDLRMSATFRPAPPDVRTLGLCVETIVVVPVDQLPPELSRASPEPPDQLGVGSGPAPQGLGLGLQSALDPPP